MRPGAGTGMQPPTRGPFSRLGLVALARVARSRVPDGLTRAVGRVDRHEPVRLGGGGGGLSGQPPLEPRLSAPVGTCEETPFTPRPPATPSLAVVAARWLPLAAAVAAPSAAAAAPPPRERREGRRNTTFGARRGAGHLTSFESASKAPAAEGGVWTAVLPPPGARPERRPIHNDITVRLSGQWV